jgi:TonB family protein
MTKILWILAIACLSLPRPLGAQLAFAETEAQTASTVVSLIGAARGPCGKGELLTDRGCLVPPHIKKKVYPSFPTAARHNRLEAQVELGLTVETDGSVGPIHLIKSSTPGQGFEEAAIEAVQKWRYKPGRLEDGPVRTYFRVTVEFTYR